MEAVALLLTYAITSALIYSDGAFGIMYRIRNIKWVKEFGIFDCFICTSFYPALAISFIANDFWLMGWAWGGSIIVDKLLIWMFTK